MTPVSNSLLRRQRRKRPTIVLPRRGDSSLTTKKATKKKLMMSTTQVTPSWQATTKTSKQQTSKQHRRRNEDTKSKTSMSRLKALSRNRSMQEIETLKNPRFGFSQTYASLTADHLGVLLLHRLLVGRVRRSLENAQQCARKKYASVTSQPCSLQTQATHRLSEA